MSGTVIVGCEGQDGRLLGDRLRRDGCSVVGIDYRRLYDTENVFRAEVDILDPAQVSAVVASRQPDEIYYLPAYHHSSQDSLGGDELLLFQKSFDVHVRGLLNFLQAVKTRSRKTRLFYAASSHVFGQPAASPQDETTPLAPLCAYGITKTAGVHCCSHYRLNHSLHVSVGILYNHESPYRPEKFVTQKIAAAAVRIKRGLQDRLELGDLSAAVDWGYAGDYVDAMVRILRLPQPDTFIIATGRTHTVQEFVQTAFGLVGLDWRDYVRENKSLINKRRMTLTGNSDKLRAMTGWKPSVTFEEMVELMVNAQRNAPLRNETS